MEEQTNPQIQTLLLNVKRKDLISFSILSIKSSLWPHKQHGNIYTLSDVVEHADNYKRAELENRVSDDLSRIILVIRKISSCFCACSQQQS